MGAVLGAVVGFGFMFLLVTVGALPHTDWVGGTCVLVGAACGIAVDALRTRRAHWRRNGR